MLYVPEYVYQPLSSEREVRILILQPAHDWAAPIECRLERHSRPEPATDPYQPLDYTAISYVWGTQAFTHSLICDGSRLPITSTVDSMLRDLRRPWRSRRFWLDAVCLNQNDMKEKRQQVPLMGEIYAEATRVKIWLGGDEETGARAINAIRSLKVFRECSKVDYLTLGALRRHPWFQRRWTIQEALLHGDTVLHFGKSRIGWNEAVNLLSAHAIKLEYKDETVLYAIERIRTMHGPKRGVLSLLKDHHAAQCGDHLDRIAALQGLVLTSEGRRFKHVLKNWPIHDPDNKLLDPTLEVLWLVDYEKDWIANFSAFTAFQLSRGHGTSIEYHLAGFGDLSRVQPDLPCW